MRLEPFFWDSLEEIARREAKSIDDLCAEVDTRRGESNLTSAVRVFVTAYFRAAATEEGHAHAQHGRLFAWLGAETRPSPDRPSDRWNRQRQPAPEAPLQPPV